MADTDRFSLDLDEMYEFAIKVGKDAGSMLMRAAQARFDSGQESHQVEKENAVDLVTQTDIGESHYRKSRFKPASSRVCSLVISESRWDETSNPSSYMPLPH